MSSDVVCVLSVVIITSLNLSFLVILQSSAGVLPSVKREGMTPLISVERTPKSTEMYRSANQMVATITYSAQRPPEHVGVCITITSKLLEQKHKENQAVLHLVSLSLLCYERLFCYFCTLTMFQNNLCVWAFHSK